ncbi:acetyl-CoA carboxylase biotin carboxyl carrier protein [Calditerricola yamamurae]
MRMHELRELIRLVDQSSIVEFEWEFEGAKVTIRKGGGVPATNGAAAAVSNEPAVPHVAAIAPSAPQTDSTPAPSGTPAAPAAAVTPPAPSAAASSAAKPADAVEDEAGLHKIVAPMVGTFYAAPAPDAEPYVKVGDKVKEDTVVCIIEAMKLFNEIEAECRGEIVKVLVENGQLVEYGQPLFLVRLEK